MSWVDTAGDAAAEYARMLLRSHGIELAVTEPAVRRTPVEDWAASGAMALTGTADGPPQLVAGAPATAVRGALLALATLAEAAGLDASRLPDERLLAERAAVMGLHRQGRRSAGGASHLLDAADGLVAFTLSRPDDFAMIAALIEGDAGDSPLLALTSWCLGQLGADVAERAALLGLAAGAVDPTLPTEIKPPSATVKTPHASGRPPLVVDLSSLWAGPLCTHLLQLLGARVVQVESRQRPDPTPTVAPAFHALLRDGVEQQTLDFADRADLQRLQRLLNEADIVIEASRPRALQQLGIDAASSGGTWLSITGYGRAQNRVGYGDDVAAAAGLLGVGPVFAGDAIGDPLAGTHAAVAALSAWQTSRGGIVEVSMYEVVRATRTATGEAEVVRDGDGWAVDDGGRLIPVAAPAARQVVR